MIGGHPIFIKIFIVLVIIGFLLNVVLVYGAPISNMVETKTASGMAIYRNNAYPVLVDVKLEPGNGTVIILGIKYDNILYMSIKNAVYEAIFINGLSPYNYKYVVTIMSPYLRAPYFTGTSLSLLVYLKTLEILYNTTLQDDVIITGTLNPDSTVGFVGNVYKKALGAVEYNFSKFIYPELDDREYKVVNETLHIGPYTFKSRAVKISEPFLENLTIETMGVSSGLDAWLYLNYGEKNISKYMYRELLNVVPRTNESIIQYLVIKKYLENIYQDILERYNKTIYNLQQTSILVKYPSLKSYFEDQFNEIENLLNAYNIYLSNGYYLSASKYLSLAYGNVKFLEYIVTLIINSNGGADWVINDYLSIETRVYNSLIQIINRGVSPENIFLLTKAARLYYEARKNTVITLLGLDFITKNYYYNRLDIKINLVSKLANSLIKLIECELLSILLSYDVGTYITPETLYKIGKLMYDYALFLTRYATQYSQVTGIYSEIINYASGYLWNYKDLSNNNGNKSIIIFASIDYLIDSIFYSQLYFNLHPGFEKVVNSRYSALRKILPIYINSSRMENSFSLQFNLERAVIYEDLPSRAAVLERTLAEIKSVLLIRELLSRQSTNTVEAYMNSVISSSNNIRRRITNDILGDLVNIIITSAILLGIFLIIFKRRG